MSRLYLKTSAFIPTCLVLLIASCCWCSVANAQGQTFSPGIAIGKKVPAISLDNQNGESVSVQSMLQTGPVALVLFRSADW